MSQSVESFAEIVRDVHRSAVHLEMRDSYGVENEADYFAAFRRGEWVRRPNGKSAGPGSTS